MADDENSGEKQPESPREPSRGPAPPAWVEQLGQAMAQLAQAQAQQAQAQAPQQPRVPTAPIEAPSQPAPAPFHSQSDAGAAPRTSTRPYTDRDDPLTWSKSQIETILEEKGYEAGHRFIAEKFRERMKRTRVVRD